MNSFAGTDKKRLETHGETLKKEVLSLWSAEDLLKEDSRRSEVSS
jgi:hypothetical protein